jgi:transcriptional regulator with XRE-family HTH domain
MLVRGQRIRTLREAKGYTLQELAVRAKVSLSYLSEIERGSKRPSLKTIDKLAQALDVPRSVMVEDEKQERGLSIGDKIRLLRKEKGLSLAELAQEAGISTSYLSEIERGAVHPSLFILKQLARAIGVPALVLMGYEGSLGHKLRMLREGYGMTQAELARRAGVTAGLIGQIEQGKVHPSLKTLEKLALATGV